jgi:hypothetical protein
VLRQSRVLALAAAALRVLVGGHGAVCLAHPWYRVRGFEFTVTGFRVPCFGCTGFRANRIAALSSCASERDVERFRENFVEKRDESLDGVGRGPLPRRLSCRLPPSPLRVGVTLPPQRSVRQCGAGRCACLGRGFRGSAPRRGAQREMAHP